MYRILIADDSWVQRKSIAKFFKEGGYEVLEAVNGVEAVEKAIAEAPDCILLDLLMPEMDGMEVLKVFQEKNLKIPVVILTADIQHTTRAKCFELGVVEFINKPVKKDEMLEVVRRISGTKGD